MAQPTAIFDDMNIATGLLTEPKDPRHRSSFTGVSFIGHDGSEPPPQQADGQPDRLHEGRSRRAMRTSNTWTSSSGDVLSDQDDIDDRTVFVQEYNRLARKHGVRQVDPEEFDKFNGELINISEKPGSWFSRKILRKTSSSQSVKLKSERQLKHRRSISDLSIRLKSKKDKLKDKDLQELVRLCGSSLLYLPTEYAAGSLAVPTCFRATAQYLVQYAPSTRGVFRVPGSQNLVAALYNHYGSMDEDGQVVSGTVRCPTLPDHIRCDVHDVASAFKKFLSGLPGGILGSLQLFNVFVSIQTQLRGDPEMTRTKQSKVRARLLALAIATLRSQFRREFICAVFGLLSMIGRAAEIAPREDDRGRPLPTSDLMGYGPLGVVFGPLLVGDFLEDYNMRIANPQGGLVLLPISPPKSRRDRHKKSKAGDEGTAFNTLVDKIKVANSVTEMLITHWRDVVRHMRNLSALKIVASTKSVAVRAPRQPMLRPSASESFALRKPPDWDQFRSPLRRPERSVSPTPARRTHGHIDLDEDPADRHGDMLVVKKQRSKSKPLSIHRLSGGRSLSILSPTAEEQFAEEQSESPFAPLLACEDPPCTSGSLPLATNPLREGVYSPSSSSEDGALPPGMIPLSVRPEEPIEVDWLDKENRNPRPAVAVADQVELTRVEYPSEHDDKQPLHFMSTPTFSNVSPSKSSRKKVRHSKESSGSTGHGKLRSHGSPSKLQKPSPAFIERGKTKHQKKLEHSEESLKVENPTPRDYDAELSQFAAEWNALDLQRKVLETTKSKKEMKNLKAVLDTQQALLEARYMAIQADKAAFEKNASVLKARLQAILADNIDVRNNELVSKRGQDDGIQRENPPNLEESSSTIPYNEETERGNVLKNDSGTLKQALEALYQDQQGLRASRLELEPDWEKFVTKWEETNAKGLKRDGCVSLDETYARFSDRVTHLNVANDAAQVNVDAIVARLGVVEPQLSLPIGQEADEDRPQSVSIIAEDPGRVDENQRQSANQLPSSSPFSRIHEAGLPLSSTIPAASGTTVDNSKTIRPELVIFKYDVAAWKAKWKLYKQGKQTISTAEKKIHDDEKAALDARCHALKTRMDAQSDTQEEGTSNSSSNSLPFKHLREKPEHLLAVPSPLNPGITISRASSHGSEESNPRIPRRIGGSDPGLQPRARSHSPRRISRSLYEDPKRKKKLFDLSKASRDPLLRVSREEDNASLAVLAQALDEPAQQLDADTENGSPQNIPNLDSSKIKSNQNNKDQVTQPISNKENSATLNHLNRKTENTKIGTAADGSPANAANPRIPRNSVSERVLEEVNKRPSEGHGFRFDQGSSSSNTAIPPSYPKLKSTESPSDVTIPSLAMQVPTQKAAQAPRRSTAPNMPENGANTGNGTGVRVSGSPNKISALVARFNKGKQESTSVSPPRMSPDRSPAETPTQPLIDSPGDIAAKVVSPYTTNPPSPAKSQKSEKTPQSSRTAGGGEARSLLDPKSSPVRRQTPKRILRDSLHESTPLRPVSQVPDAQSLRSLSSPNKAPSIYAVSLRSVKKEYDGSPTRKYSRPAAAPETRGLVEAVIEERKGSASKDKDSSMLVPPPLFSINTLRKAEVHAKETSASSSRTVRPVHDPTKELTTGALRANLESNHVHWQGHGASSAPQTQSGLPVFDGPQSTSNIGRVLPRPDPGPVAHHLNLARPPATSPIETELESAKHIAGAPPGRSSSVLYNQVRTLQRQLSEKTEEIQHLKQHLSSRGNADIGTLSEELRQTKRDLQMWKTRAEVAEKQLEIMNKLPSRSNSLKHTNSTSSRGADNQHRPSTDSRHEEGTMADRIRKALHGMDGADSPRRYSSEESTETVIRDFGDAVPGSNNPWQEHATNRTSSAYPKKDFR